MRVFWTPIDTLSPWAWIATLVVTIGAFLMFRMTWPLVKNAWDEVDEAMTVRLAR